MAGKVGGWRCDALQAGAPAQAARCGPGLIEYSVTSQQSSIDPDEALAVIGCASEKATFRQRRLDFTCYGLNFWALVPRISKGGAVGTESEEVRMVGSKKAVSTTFTEWNKRAIGKYETRKDQFPTEANPWSVSTIEQLLSILPGRYKRLVELGAWQCNSAEAIRVKFGEKLEVEASEIDVRKVEEAKLAHPELEIYAADAVMAAEKQGGTPCIYLAINVLGHVPVEDMSALVDLIVESKSALVFQDVGLAGTAEVARKDPKGVVSNYNYHALLGRAGMVPLLGTLKLYGPDYPSGFEPGLRRFRYSYIFITP